MEDREFEQLLESTFSVDRSAGTEEFRDGLLKRCLSLLGSGDENSEQSAHIIEGDFCRELSDDELDMLAAAGDWQDALMRNKLGKDGPSIF